jgi:hypothetical protein
MRKLFLGSIALTTFSASIILFQISCQKPAEAQTGNGSTYVLPPATTTKLGGVMPDGTTITVDATGKISSVGSNGGIQQKNLVLYSFYRDNDLHEFWLMNTDGSNKRQINITMPAGIRMAHDGRLTADGTMLIFEAYKPNTQLHYLYSVNVDGTNLKQLLETTLNNNDELNIMGTY